MPSLLPHDLCHGRSSSLAPSSDRIPVELFQILKYDAVESAALNMQYAICTQYAICRLTAVGESGLETPHSNGSPESWRVPSNNLQKYMSKSRRKAFRPYTSDSAMPRSPRYSRAHASSAATCESRRRGPSA